MFETWVNTQGCLLYKLSGRGGGGGGRPLSIDSARGIGYLISPPAKAVILFLLNYSNLSYLKIYSGANLCVPHTQMHLLKPCATRPLSTKDGWLPGSGKSTMTPSHHSVPGL